MNGLIQANLDFSLFILQFNFFNGFASSERYDFAKNDRFVGLSAFSSAQVLTVPMVAR